VTLFLFAHQDDEFGVFQALDECRKHGRRAICAYLTRGTNGLAERRNEESRRVLSSLGVSRDDIVFAGDELGIDDATLPDSMPRAGEWIARWMASFPTLERIYVTAWEGGHHDHDALHAMVVQAAQRFGHLPLVRQFALYNRYGCPGPFFRVLTPLAANGPVQAERIPVRRRLAYLRLCLQYPTQRKTWVGLLPFVVLHYALRGTQTLQPVSLERLRSRPHDATLYYEQRGFYRWEAMQERLREWQFDL
jgi:LmbE family N-acetylglucosaminyl deacetylase